MVTNNRYYVRLQKNVTEETWQKIQLAMSQLSFGVDEEKLPGDRARLFPQPARNTRFSPSPVDDQIAGVSERLAGGAGAGFVGTDELTRGRPAGFANLGPATASNWP